MEAFAQPVTGSTLMGISERSDGAAFVYFIPLENN